MIMNLHMLCWKKQFKEMSSVLKWVSVLYRLTVFNSIQVTQTEALLRTTMGAVWIEKKHRMTELKMDEGICREERRRRGGNGNEKEERQHLRKEKNRKERKKHYTGELSE